MKVGLVGFAGSGKSTVFHWLTGVKPDPGKAMMGQSGNAKVPDPRLDWLSAKFNPKKTTPTDLDFLDTQGVSSTERRDNPRRLALFRVADGLLVVLNGFGEPDQAGQLRRFREELVFADLEIVSNRISKLQDQIKKPRPAKLKEQDEKELALLERINAALEQNVSPKTLGLSEEDEKAIRSFQLLTLKPEHVLVNISEDRIGQPLPDDLLALAPNAIPAPARFELELEELPPEEREVFVKDFLGDRAVDELTQEKALRTIFTSMGMQVFFTVGEDECRAWSIPKGADAVTGASKIHTDLADGFVRAEVVGYEDFQRAGSMKEAKQLGVYRLEGKTYIVKDGDIMHILAGK
jgi:ribosome-binding ATPase YchF (GTP1/OBG family)